jgi:chromosome segregation protein
MRLERLEINGFKSFSDRSELAFDKGVTAIVGPNGCGKSNVVDAITWVMGEQSAKSLRGDRMEDVIFSGSDARKPTASAEVRLRFSGVVRNVTGPAFPEAASDRGYANGNGHHGNGNGNGNGHHLPVTLVGDGQFEAVAVAPPPTARAYSREEAEEVIQSVAREVEVTRRLYRSGESEYLIDGQTCRLRDVHELLMDTGLGAKAYAIIEQGKIGLILSSRPTDRRQLIEEAAGVTKYKSRRRAAELKLEAAQQNLTRIDDIVFEVEKQRGTLKRQAAKARRYRKLRDEMRRWEKQLFARRYRQLAETVESARGRLAGARERESAAAARVSEVESDLARARIELVEAEAHATNRREAAHACELDVNRRQQQIAFDREQVQALGARTSTVVAELDALHARREPARLALLARQAAADEAVAERERAAELLAAESEAYESAHRDIEGLEADVEAARSEVFSAINAATALRHSLEHAASARERVVETLARLAVETDDQRIEAERAAADLTSASEGLRREQEAIEATRIARQARESELASARIEHDWRARAVRTHEQEVAALEARLHSLQELEAARAEYGDAARTVLAQANGRVAQQGAVADYLEVEAGFERAVETALGDLLQYVIVERPEHAAAGLELVRDHRAGRCGFIIATETPEEPAGTVEQADLAAPPPGLRALSSVVRVGGPFAPIIRRAIGDAWIADAYAVAAEQCGSTAAPIATISGELFRGPHLVSGGVPAEARGILETKRAIKDLRERLDDGRDTLRRLGDEAASFEQAIAHASTAIAALHAEHHKHEKATVAFEAQVRRAEDDRTRLEQKREQLGRERRQLDDERELLDSRQEEARSSIVQLERQQREADATLTSAQRRLFEAREAAQDLAQRAAGARADHAGLVERASAIAAEVLRMREAAAELELRASSLAAERDALHQRVEELHANVVEGECQLDKHVRTLGVLRDDVRAADAAAAVLRTQTEALETLIRDARAALESIRGAVAELDLARATAESDLAHLAQTCLDAVQATLDDVLAEVAAIEAAGGLVADAAALAPEEGDDPGDEEGAVVPTVDGAEMEAEARGASDLSQPGAAVLEAEQRTLSAEDAIARLRAKIDRLGPVNMMAIEQFDELEQRHAFLTTQRRDLVDSIAQTSEAIKRIDETTRVRFAEAFAAINRNFQELFSTLFGGGRAGLTLLDESDPLESGIEIIAQPPGKRLQSVQLLSGGEKALTAISLMFALFQYKPSPFCLLDEIDAPLDDANIGRFVEMLRGMQKHTQFILITHHRKTMEIADRLYGVTMEEPGVSKLISVQVN